MAFTYTVSFSTNQNGPWTPFGSPVSTTTDTITGLSPSTNYFVQIITTDTATGLTSTPVVAGPFSTAASAGPTESAPGSSVVNPSQTIFASRLIGQPSPAGAQLDTWTLSAPGGVGTFAVLNGVSRTSDTADVTQLYYINHLLYQTSPNGNALGTPGWWSWNGTGWTDATNPIPAGPTISINTISAQTTNAPFGVSGSMLNYLTVPTLQYQDNQTGSWTNLPTQPTSTSSFNFTHPGMAANAAAMVGIRDANNTTITALSNPFVISTPGVVTITGVTLSASSVASGVSGATVGTISVQTVGGAYTGTNSLSGTDAASFSIVSNATLQTAAALAARNYTFNIIATMSGAGGSPFTSSQIVTALAGPATGPVVSNSFLTADFGATTGHTLSPWLFGSSMASDIDFLGGTGSTGWSTPSIQQAAKNTAGFGLPGMFARCNTNETSFNGDGSNNNTFNDRVSQFLPQIISMPTSAADTAHGQFSYSLGVNSPSIGNGEGGFAGNIGPVTPSQYANASVACAQRFVSNGTPIYYWEVGNEPDGRLDVNEYCRLVNSTAVALKGFDPTYKIIAGVVAGDVGFIHTVAQQCGSNLDIMSYHHYSTNPSDFGGMATNIRNAMLGTACAAKPAMQGEYNQNGDGTGNNSQQTNNGMMTNIAALYFTWKADPLTLIGAIWDWLGDANYGLIGDVNGTPSGVPAGNVIQTGYALKNLRSHMGGTDGSPGTEVSITSNGAGVLAIATKNSTNFGLWLINQNGSATGTGQIAFSRWPVNTSGNATLNVYTVNDAHPQSQTTTLAVTGGLSASISIPGNSVVVISNH